MQKNKTELKWNPISCILLNWPYSFLEWLYISYYYHLSVVLTQTVLLRSRWIIRNNNYFQITIFIHVYIVFNLK